MSKVHPFSFNEKFLLYFDFLKSPDLSIGESMVPYYSRHGENQFFRDKLIRFELKMFGLSIPLGYCLQFEPYQGPHGRQMATAGVGMGGSVVINMIAKLQQDQSSHLTFDNQLTSLKLDNYLTAKGITCTGTIHFNCIEDCPLKSRDCPLKSKCCSLKSRYCPLKSRYCPLKSRYCPIKFRYSPIKFRYCPLKSIKEMKRQS